MAADKQNIPNDLITQTEFSRIRGCAVPTVNKLIAKYNVPRYGGGKISLSEATRILADNEQPNKQRMGQGGDAPADEKTPVYNVSRAKREYFNALKAEAEYEKIAGNLISRKTVEEAAAKLGNHLRNRLRDFSSSIADDLAQERDPRKIKALIDDRLFEYINDTVDQLRQL